MSATAPAPRRIGLFGGSFDPPHLAHLELARQALRQLALDELRWVVAGRPWQKRDRALAEPAQRTAMVRLLIAAEPRMLVDETELRRDGPSYTIDTVRELHRTQPQASIVLVIGQDQYAHFDTWRDWPELLALTTLAVAARDGRAARPPAALQREPHRVLALEWPDMPHSSTAVRARVAEGGDVAALTGAAVAGYISRHALYRAHRS